VRVIAEVIEATWSGDSEQANAANERFFHAALD